MIRNAMLLTLGIVIALTGFAQSYVAQYHLSGDAQDASGNNNHGTLYGPIAAVDRFSSPGEALSFDGVDDYVDISNGLLNGLDEFTIYAWVNVQSHDAVASIISNGQSSSNSVCWRVLGATADGAVASQVNFSGGSFSMTSGAGMITPGNYQLFTVTYDGFTARLFVDGGEVVSQEISAGAVSLTGLLRIGRRAGNAEHPFDGAIDEVGIMNTALTESQVYAIYTETFETAIYDDFADGMLNSDLWSPSYKDDSNTTYHITEEPGYLYAQPEAIAKRWIYSNGPEAIDWKTVPNGSKLYFDISTMSCRGHARFRFVDAFPTDTWNGELDGYGDVFFASSQEAGCTSQWFDHTFEISLFPSQDRIFFYSDNYDNVQTSANDYLPEYVPNNDYIDINSELTSWYIQIASLTGSAPETTGLKVNSIRYTLGVEETESDTLFFDNFSSDLSQWSIHGSPSPFIDPSNGLPAPSFNTNDDANWGGIAHSVQTFDYANDSLVFSADVLPVASGDQHMLNLYLNKTNEFLNNNAGYDPFLMLTYRGAIHPLGPSLYIYLMYDSLGVEYLETAEPGLSDGTGWKNISFKIRDDQYVEFYCENELKYTSQHPVTQVYSGEAAIGIGNRRGFIDNVTAVRTSNEETENIAVSIPQIEAILGETVNLPVYLNSDGTESYVASELDFSGYSGNMIFQAIETSGSLLESMDWTWAINEEDGVLQTAFAGSNAISDEGVFCYLQFQVVGDICTTVPVNCDFAMFNTTEVTDITNGSVYIEPIPEYGDVELDGYVGAFDAAQVLCYVVDACSLDCQQWYNADVDLSDTVDAMDAVHILRYTVDLIDTFPVESASPDLLAHGDLWTEEQIIVEGQPLILPIYISEGDNVYSVEAVFTYDPGKLELPISDTITLTQAGFSFRISDDGNGRVKFAAARSEESGPIDGEFMQVNIAEVLDADFGDDPIVSFEYIKLNSNLSQAVDIVVSTDELSETPQTYALNQNYPNPFNPTTIISYGLPEASEVSLVVYDVTGREINRLVQTRQNAGWYDVQWNGLDATGFQVSTGLYFARIEAGAYSQVIKMVYLQ